MKSAKKYSIMEAAAEKELQYVARCKRFTRATKLTEARHSVAVHDYCMQHCNQSGQYCA